MEPLTVITLFSLSPFVIWGGIIAICLVVLAIIAFILKKIFSRPDLVGMSREDIKRQWNQIEDLVMRNDGMSHKLAVMEADKLLDHALKAMGFAGMTLAERLKVAAYRYPSIRNVWPAHAARNRMVHEASYHLDRGTARDAIRRYHNALKELNIL